LYFFQDLVAKIKKEVGDVKTKLEKQKAAEEQDRLRKIQEEMERERKRKEDEEKREKEVEADRKAKAEMEARRKEEEVVNEQLDADRRTARELQERLNDENRKLREQIEQERRDHELALRLAMESKSGVSGVDDLTTPPTARSVAPANAVAKVKSAKYDLSNWKYAELRDTINTSCDIDLLEACREEFHRRLKVYHAWKSKNRKSKGPSGGPPGASGSGPDDVMRAPSSIMAAAAAASTGAIQKSGGTSARNNSAAKNDEQRFFRIPFVRPGGEPEVLNNSSSALSPSHQSAKGWWYAHFDGDWIARQMEIHPDRKPVLLVAGKDDMQMCELSLTETELTRKRGAEILENAFEREWESNGGRAYVRPTARGASSRPTTKK
jgi:myosin-6